jgi:hypothetical protein
LQGLTFVKVFTSPLQRVSRTCELAGFKAAALVDPPARVELRRQRSQYSVI